VTESGSPVWPGWPVETKRQLSVALPELFHEHAGGDDVVLLTHSGPAGVSTTIVSGIDPNYLTAAGVRDQWIYRGSAALRAFISRSQQQRRLLLALHGHTHAGVGSAMLGSIASGAQPG
jgi:Icc-related predicted phosphoesterase